MLYLTLFYHFQTFIFSDTNFPIGTKIYPFNVDFLGSVNSKHLFYAHVPKECLKSILVRVLEATDSLIGRLLPDNWRIIPSKSSKIKYYTISGKLTSIPIILVNPIAFFFIVLIWCSGYSFLKRILKRYPFNLGITYTISTHNTYPLH